MAETTTLRVGFGRVEITPEQPFPMAGMMSRQERLAERVRDPLRASALAFDDGTHTALLVSADLLLITSRLQEEVERRLREAGARFDGLLLSATHSHSATGGYWDTPSARLFMGQFRQRIFDTVAAGITAAALAALADRQPATLSFGETQTTYLNYNRRHAGGPIDRTLGVLHVARSGPDIRLVCFGAHPVVVGFRDYHACSADYPGELVRNLEADGDLAMFVVGPVGGVNTFFPEGPLDLEAHLALLTRLMREEVDRAAAAATAIHGGEVRFAAGETSIEVIAPRLLPDRLAWLDVLLWPVRLYARRFGRRGLDDGPARVPVFRVGDLVFTGFPADLGAGVGLAARAHVAGRGKRLAVAASQTGGYVGYVHLPPEYQQFESEDKAAMWMNIYENAMAFGGREVGVRLLTAFDDALARVDQ